MRKNKTSDGKWNLCGANIAQLRMQLQPGCSQRALADKLQLLGLDVSKNTIQMIEAGERTVSDIELKAFAEVFGVTVDELLSE